MEPLKKAGKKSFSVPCAKGKTGGTVDNVTHGKASSQAGKDLDSQERKKDTATKGKKTDKPKSSTGRTTAKKASSGGVSGCRKPTPRSLTDAEYEAIFQAVIEDCTRKHEDYTRKQEEEENIYMAPTQIDSPKKESATNSTETAHAEKHYSVHEEDSDFEPPDKENLSRSKNALENAMDSDYLVSDANEHSESKPKHIDTKPLNEKDNNQIKTSDNRHDDCTASASAQNKRPKKKGTGEEVTKKDKKKKNSQERRPEEGQSEGNEGKVKPTRKRKKKNDSTFDQGTTTVEEDAGAAAKKKDKKASGQNKSKPKQSVKDDSALNNSDKDNDSNENEAADIDDGGEESKNVCANSNKQETCETESNQKQKQKHKGGEKGKSFKKGSKRETMAEKASEEGKNKPLRRKKDDCEPVQRDVKAVISKKTYNSTECEKDKKNQVDCKKEKKNGESAEHEKEKDEVASQKEKKTVNSTECENEKKDEVDSQNEIESEHEKGRVLKNEDKAEMSCEEKEENAAKYEEEEEEDDVSVVSDQSLNSSLLDMAQAVDQWDRLEEMKEHNEHTPRVHEAEDKPTVAHKPRKRKPRKNQLAPRKLSFDGAASNKKRRREEESDSDVAASIPAELGTWVQCEAKGCHKWRYLSNVHDPMVLPSHWVCYMNTDQQYNSCDAPQQVCDESDHIFTKYTLGSLVWAKMDGFPWWPAMVDSDPDCDLYCQIPHEDSMVPTEYHVVFLDEVVTRSWVRQSRIQPLTMAHLAPGSIYMKGHKYKKEIQVAMRRAEIASHIPLQDRVNQFGFSACFRNVGTRWTKGEVKTKTTKRLKRKPQKPGDSQRAMSGPTSAKKRRLATSRQLSKEDSDSDSCASHSASSPDLSSSSVDGGDDDSDVDDVVQKRSLARRKHRAKQNECEGRKVLKDVSANKKIAERKQANRKGLGRLTSKKKFQAFLSSTSKSHEMSCSGSGKTEGDQQGRTVYTTESESSADVSSVAKACKSLKKKFKSAKKMDSKSLGKENGHRKDALSVSNSKDRNKDETKKGKKKTSETKAQREKTPCIKGKMNKVCKNVGSTKNTDKATNSPKPDNNGEVVQKPSSDQPPKKKKLFKSEMARKRDEALELQQKEKQTDCASIGDKKPKTKSQKFVAPVKTMSEKSDSCHNKESPKKTEAEPQSQKENQEYDADLTLTVPEQDPPADLDENLEQNPPVLSPQPRILTLTTKQFAAESLTPRKSSPLNKDQFVPSMEESDKDSDEDRITFMEDTDKGWKKREGSERKEEERQGESDSDCLDLEEDLPLPSLQQVLEVPSKGCSDHDTDLSDPLEITED